MNCEQISNIFLAKEKHGRSRHVPADEILNSGASLLEALQRKCLMRLLLLETGMSTICTHSRKIASFETIQIYTVVK